MKKRILVSTVLVFTLFLLFVGCARQNDSTASVDVSETTPTPDSVPAQTPELDLDKKENTMKITIGNTVLTAALVDNSSVKALKELLSKGPLTINMQDYSNMEKVGPIGTELPRNDEQISTDFGDIILYQGNSLVIYYDRNSWNFTRIGRIDGVKQEELKTILGSDNVTVTFSLN